MVPSTVPQEFLVGDETVINIIKFSFTTTAQPGPGTVTCNTDVVTG